MRKLFSILGLVLLLGIPTSSSAYWVEAAVGIWQQNPDGDISYKGSISADTLDLERDLGYDDELRIMGRVRIRTPKFLPNIYLMGTPMESDGTGRKSENFRFGDKTFTGGPSFYSKLTLDHYDIAIYYEFPALKTASIGTFDMDGGLDVRIIDFKAELTGTTAAGSETETKSFTLPLPLVYFAARVAPVDRLSIEAEARGIYISDNHMLSLIGRVKVKAFGPMFGTVGYRYEGIKIDVKDIVADIDFIGPFLEAGIQF